MLRCESCCRCKLKHKSYVPFESNHPLHIYTGVAYGEAWRLLKRSSSAAAYDSALLELLRKLTQAHFPERAMAAARRLSFDKHRDAAVAQMRLTHSRRYVSGAKAKAPDRLLMPLLYDRNVTLEPILRDVIQSSIDMLPKRERTYVRNLMVGFKLQPKAANRLGINDASVSRQRPVVPADLPLRKLFTVKIDFQFGGFRAVLILCIMRVCSLH